MRKKTITALFIIIFSISANATTIEDLIKTYGKRAIMEEIDGKIDNKFTISVDGTEKEAYAPSPDYINASTLTVDIERAGMTVKSVESIFLGQAAKAKAEEKSEPDTHKRRQVSQEKTPPVTYQDRQGYKDYLKLPKAYQSQEMAAVYKNGYTAEEKVKNLPCKMGGTINDCLDKKASLPAVDDLGWITSPYQGEFEVERMMLLDNLRLVYRWHVSADGQVTATNGKAIGITADK